jgi:hypothetical protein
MDSILIHIFIDGKCISEDLIPLQKAISIATKRNASLFNPTLDFRYYDKSKAEVYPLFYDSNNCVGFE